MKKINIKDRKLLYGVLSIVFICIFTLSIAYAALSATLTILGSGKVSATNWDIEITNSGEYTNVTTGSATYTTPTITGTTIANYTVGLTKPGDSVTLYFDVYNNGDINGEISSITNSVPTCVSETGNTADAKLVCDNLIFDFKYTWLGIQSDISVGHVLNTDRSTCFSGSTLSEVPRTSLQLTISLNSSMNSVPSSKVTVSNLKNEIVYVQTDKSCETYGGNHI